MLESQPENEAVFFMSVASNFCGTPIAEPKPIPAVASEEYTELLIIRVPSVCPTRPPRGLPAPPRTLLVL